MKVVKFKDLLDKFDCFLFDQWGVIHDGKKKFKFIDKTLKKLQSKCCIVISNTSQNKSEAKKNTLKKLNINHTYFDKIVTSGEYLEHIALSKEKKFIRFNKFLKLKKCYLITNGSKNEVFKNIGLKKTNIKSAKFILAMSVKPFENFDRYKKILDQLISKKLTMLCSNPDKFVFDGKVNKFVLQVGTLAAYYKKIGGKVLFIGKPYIGIFSYSLKNLNFKKNRILMIGDNTQTDIAGANRFGIKSALVLDGFNKNELNNYKNKNLNTIFKSLLVRPNFVIKNISI
jgi:HAD superfamily hydrolase (TIGR01459 family)